VLCVYVYGFIQWQVRSQALLTDPTKCNTFAVDLGFFMRSVYDIRVSP